MDDCLPWEGPHTGTREECEESSPLESWLTCITVFIWTMWVHFIPAETGHRGKEVCVCVFLSLAPVSCLGASGAR